MPWSLNVFTAFVHHLIACVEKCVFTLQIQASLFVHAASCVYFEHIRESPTAFVCCN